MKYTFGRWWGAGSGTTEDFSRISIMGNGLNAGYLYRNGTFKSCPIYDREQRGTIEPLKKFDDKKFASQLECLKALNEDAK